MLFDHFFLSDFSLKTPYITRYVRRFCLKKLKKATYLIYSVLSEIEKIR
mgnify:CR=1 FL=1